MLSNKRGETLIEIVVSFAILSLVMIGMASLITDLVGMATESRTVTEATALAQKGMAVGLGKVNSQCDLRTGATFSYPASPHQHVYQELGSSIKLEVLLLDLDPSQEESSVSGLTSANGFQKLVSTASWRDKKGDPKTYNLSQVVHR
jgi:hypothetical protein